jgi:hypothetical protein
MISVLEIIMYIVAFLCFKKMYLVKTITFLKGGIYKLMSSVRIPSLISVIVVKETIILIVEELDCAKVNFVSL